MDPANGDPSAPLSLNKYLYANANPLVYYDPDGRASVSQNLDEWERDCDSGACAVGVRANVQAERSAMV